MPDEPRYPDPMVREFVDALAKLTKRNLDALREAVAAGKLTEDALTGSMVLAMLRGIDRITALPDERDLTDEEVQHFQAALLQVAINSFGLLLELPLPAMHVVLQGFDTSNPQ